MPSRFFWSVFVLLLSISTAEAQDWAKRMFKVTAHDFGAVARGAKTEFRFPFKNVYVEDLHVVSVRSSCGCTSPEVTKRDLKTYETGYVVATFNTNAFVGYKSATVTVTFDKPFYAEVQLQVSGNIRGDIIVQPNFVDLGTINQGQPAERAVTVTHTARPDWKIVDVRSANTNFEVDVIEKTRHAGNVSYDLKVKVKDSAPAGYIKDQLVLVTNDQQAATLPINVEGRIVPEITVVQSINFGAVEEGKKTIKPLIVRGQKPFRITDVTCSDERFSFKLPPEDAPAKTLFTIPVTFTAEGDPGRVVRKIIVHTDRGNATLPAVIAYADVRSSATPAPVPTETPVSESEDSSPDRTTPDISRSQAPLRFVPRSAKSVASK
ncbi:MAG: DUF1573 domain-containing protein [Pirellulales bacterium]